MGAGDVHVSVTTTNTTDIDTALTALRVTAGANGKYLMTSIQNGSAILLVAIEEA
jgi:hypothetical protein